MGISYGLVLPSLRGAETCGEWASGKLPFPVFRRIDWNRSGYKVVDSIREEPITVNGQSEKFWTGHFEKKKPSGVESIRIYWGWSSDGAWQAPEYPRLYFAAAPRLHKLYLIHPVSGRDAPDDLAAYKEFLTQYVTELSRRIAH